MSLIGRSLSHQRNARISCADDFDHAIGLPDQVEGLRIIPRGKPVRGLGHDRHAVLQAGMLRCVGCEKGGKRAQEREFDSACDFPVRVKGARGIRGRIDQLAYAAWRFREGKALWGRNFDVLAQALKAVGLEG